MKKDKPSLIGENQNYMTGAFILTIGVVIMKILGAIYKVPVQHIIGDEGYSLFTSTYSVYNVFLTMATAGLPVALSRLVAEARAEGRGMQIKRTFSVAWWLFFAVGTVCFLVMYLFPDWLASDVLSNPDAALGIRVMSPAVLLVCIVSAYRGFCQGHENMIPTTVGQVLEVLLKVIAGLICARLFMLNTNNTSYGSAGAIFGVVVGSVAALVYMMFYKRRHYRGDVSMYYDVSNYYDSDEDDIPQFTNKDKVDSSKKILGDLLKIGVPIALGSSIMAILNLVDSGLCMGRLQDAAGFSYAEAKVLHGVYGSAQTLFNLPAAFITPLTISIVPAIAAAVVLKEKERTAKITEDALRISTVVCLPMGVGLAVMSNPIMKVVFPTSHQSGPVLLCIMGIAAFFVCFVLIENSILQATGNEKKPMWSMLVGSIVKIVVNWFLVANPKINIVGAPVGTLCGYITMAVMNYYFITKNMEYTPNLIKICLKPMISAGAMALVAIGTYIFCDSLLALPTLISLGAGVGLAVVVYFALILITGTLNGEDFALIPKGERIAKLLHIQ